MGRKLKSLEHYKVLIQYPKHTKHEDILRYLNNLDGYRGGEIFSVEKVVHDNIEVNPEKVCQTNCLCIDCQIEMMQEKSQSL